MTKQTQNFSKNRHLQQEMLSRFCAEVATWTFIGNTWNNHIITSGKIRPFLNKQQLHLFPLKTYRFWRSWIFTFKLDFKPSITTASSENPANHLRSVQKEQAPSCQDCQRQWEGPVHQLSWDQNPLRVIDPLRIVSDATCPPQCVMELLAYSPASPAPCIVQ